MSAPQRGPRRMQQHAPLLLFSVGGDATRGGEDEVAHGDSGILDEVATIL